MKDSEVLRRTKKIIAKRNEDFICFAMKEVINPNSQQYISLRKWIEFMLDGVITYTAWLYVNHPKFYKTIDDSDFTEGRLQWLDWMIAYCEKEEAK